MPERFTPEYIDFITESKPIQAHWQKRGVQEWDYIYNSYQGLHGPGVGVVIGFFEYASIRQPVIRYLDKRTRTTQLDDYIFWLPTLSDLLDMLEQAGWSWNAHHIPGDESVPTRGYALEAMRITDFWASDYDAQEHSDTESSRELAAARLLERVLAGKEEEGDE